MDKLGFSPDNRLVHEPAEVLLQRANRKGVGRVLLKARERPLERKPEALEQPLVLGNRVSPFHGCTGLTYGRFRGFRRGSIGANAELMLRTSSNLVEFDQNPVQLDPRLPLAQHVSGWFNEEDRGGELGE